MARSPEETELGIALFEKRIAELEEFNPRTITDRKDPKIPGLQGPIDRALSRVFGGGTQDYDRYSWAGTIDTAGLRMGETPMSEVREGLERGKERAIELLNRAIEQLQEDLEQELETHAAPVAVSQTDNSKVFLVHGHDEEAKQTVARFLEKLDLQVIILHEQASGGKTVIEKVEHYADVGFAMVLVTPDDVGGPGADDLKSRARQNVIFELGFFVGKLGRSNVLALLKGNVEWPSDFDGVIYKRLEDGDWQTAVVKEMKEAGLAFDANKMFG